MFFSATNIVKMPQRYALAQSATALAMSSVNVFPPSPRRVRVAAPTGHIVRAHLASGSFKKDLSDTKGHRLL